MQPMDIDSGGSSGSERSSSTEARSETLSALFSKLGTSFLQHGNRSITDRKQIGPPTGLAFPAAPAAATATAAASAAAPVIVAPVPVPDLSSPLKWMQASLEPVLTAPIRRLAVGFEAAARPVALEHRIKQQEEVSRARVMWMNRPPPPLSAAASALMPVRSLQPRPPPPPAPPRSAPPVQRLLPPPPPPPPPRDDQMRLIVGDCEDEKTKSRCYHEVKIYYPASANGPARTESEGVIAGVTIWRIAEQRGLPIPDRWLVHLSEQRQADVNRMQQTYRKAERKTVAGLKRKKPAGSNSAKTSATPTDKGGGVAPMDGLTQIDIFGKRSIKPQKRQSRSGIGGRRSGTATSKHRLRTFVRSSIAFPLTVRNSVHKGTTAPVRDMPAMRDRCLGAYDSLTFPAIQFRTTDPHGTVSLMASGELSVSSATSEDEALILAYQQVIQNTLYFGTPAILENFGNANTTASAGLGWPIDLDALKAFIDDHENKKSITFNRSRFPGLHWTLIEPKGVVLGFFALGFVNAVGLKRDAHFKFVRDVLLPEINANRSRLESKTEPRELQRIMTSGLSERQIKDSLHALQDAVLDHADRSMQQ